MSHGHCCCTQHVALMLLSFVTAASVPGAWTFMATDASRMTHNADMQCKMLQLSMALCLQAAPCLDCRTRQAQQPAQAAARYLTPLCPLPGPPVETPCSKAPLQAMQPPTHHPTRQSYPPGRGTRLPPDPPGRALLEALLGLLEGQGLPSLLGGLSL